MNSFSLIAGYVRFNADPIMKCQFLSFYCLHSDPWINLLPGFSFQKVLAQCWFLTLKVALYKGG